MAIKELPQIQVSLDDGNFKWTDRFDQSSDLTREFVQRLLKNCSLTTELPELLHNVLANDAASIFCHNTLDPETQWFPRTAENIRGLTSESVSFNDIVILDKQSQKRVDVNLRDVISGMELFRVSGYLTKVARTPENGSFIVRAVEQNKLKTKIPTKTIADVFPLAAEYESSATTETVRVVFGQAVRVRMFRLSADGAEYGPIDLSHSPDTSPSSNGLGGITVQAVYKDGMVVPTHQYRVESVHRDGAYYGVIVFIDDDPDGSGKIRVSASGNTNATPTILLDIVNTNFNQNHANIARWALLAGGFGVDDTAYVAARQEYARLKYVAGGVLTHKIGLDDFLRDVLVHGAYLASTSEFNPNQTVLRIIVDRENLHTYRPTPNILWTSEIKNIDTIQNFQEIDLLDRVKTYRLEAYSDPGIGQDSGYRMSATKTDPSLTEGRDLIVQNEYIYDLDTLKYECDYRARRLFTAIASLALTPNISFADDIRLNHQYAVEIHPLGVFNTRWIVNRVRYTQGRFDITFTPYDPSWYRYQSANLECESNVEFSSPVDFNRTRPGIPPNFRIVGGPENGFTLTEDDKSVRVVFGELSADAPIDNPENVDALVFTVFKDGELISESVERVNVRPLQKNVTVTVLLIPNTSYDFTVYAYNSQNFFDQRYDYREGFRSVLNAQATPESPPIVGVVGMPGTTYSVIQLKRENTSTLVNADGDWYWNAGNANEWPGSVTLILRTLNEDFDESFLRIPIGGTVIIIQNNAEITWASYITTEINRTAGRNVILVALSLLNGYVEAKENGTKIGALFPLGAGMTFKYTPTPSDGDPGDEGESGFSNIVQLSNFVADVEDVSASGDWSLSGGTREDWPNTPTELRVRIPDVENFELIRRLRPQAFATLWVDGDNWIDYQLTQGLSLISESRRILRFLNLSVQSSMRKEPGGFTAGDSISLRYTPPSKDGEPGVDGAPGTGGFTHAIALTRYRASTGAITSPGDWLITAGARDVWPANPSIFAFRARNDAQIALLSNVQINAVVTFFVAERHFADYRVSRAVRVLSASSRVIAFDNLVLIDGYRPEGVGGFAPGPAAVSFHYTPAAQDGTPGVKGLAGFSDVSSWTNLVASGGVVNSTNEWFISDYDGVVWAARIFEITLYAPEGMITAADIRTRLVRVQPGSLVTIFKDEGNWADYKVGSQSNNMNAVSLRGLTLVESSGAGPGFALGDDLELRFNPRGDGKDGLPGLLGYGQAFTWDTRVTGNPTGGGQWKILRGSTSVSAWADVLAATSVLFSAIASVPDDDWLFYFEQLHIGDIISLQNSQLPTTQWADFLITALVLSSDSTYLTATITRIEDEERSPTNPTAITSLRILFGRAAKGEDADPSPAAPPVGPGGETNAIDATLQGSAFLFFEWMTVLTVRGTLENAGVVTVNGSLVSFVPGFGGPISTETRLTLEMGSNAYEGDVARVEKTFIDFTLALLGVTTRPGFDTNHAFRFPAVPQIAQTLVVGSFVARLQARYQAPNGAYRSEGVEGSRYAPTITSAHLRVSVPSENAIAPVPEDDFGDSSNVGHSVDRNSSTAGVIGHSTDADVFNIEIVENGTLVVYTTGESNTTGQIWKAGVNLGFDNDSGVGGNFRLEREVTSGTYAVVVRANSSQATPTNYTFVSEFTAGDLPPPEIPRAEISDTSPNPGQTLTCTVSGGTGSIDYEWQRRASSSGSWSPASGISGYTTRSIRIPSGTSAGVQFRCEIERGGQTVRTSTATVQEQAPIITVTISPTDPEPGDRLRCSVSGGSGTIGYQWRRRRSGGSVFGNLSGETGSTYDVPNNAADGDSYVCGILRNGQTLTSNIATVDVPAAPIIVATLNRTTVMRGQTIRCSVSGGSGSIDYQWQLVAGGSWSNIGGETSRDYDVSNTAPNGRRLRCRVVRNNVSDTSPECRVVVPPPADDHGDTRATATNIGTISGVNSSSGNIETARDVDYFRFTVPSGGGTLIVHSSGSVDVDGRLESSTGRLIASNNDSGVGDNFRISSQAVSAGTHYVRVTGQGSETGGYTVVWTFTPTPTGPTEYFDISETSTTDVDFDGPIMGVAEAYHEYSQARRSISNVRAARVTGRITVKFKTPRMAGVGRVVFQCEIRYASGSPTILARSIDLSGQSTSERTWTLAYTNINIRANARTIRVLMGITSGRLPFFNVFVQSEVEVTNVVYTARGVES